MKKKTILCLITIILLLCSSCSGHQEHTTTTAVQSEMENTVEKTDVEEQLEFLAENFELWKAEDESDWWGYAVTDLDQNGRLEVITSESHGTGHYTTTVIREVNPDSDRLTLCGKDASCEVDILQRLAAGGCPQPCGPLIAPQLYYSDESQTYSVYYDSKADLYHYIFADCINVEGDWYGTFENQRSFSLQDGEITGSLLSYKKFVYGTGSAHESYQDCWDISGRYITDKAYQVAATRCYSDLESFEAKILWIGDQHLGEIEEREIYDLLESSMNSFILEKV